MTKLRLTDDVYGEITAIALAIPLYAYKDFPETIEAVIQALPTDANLEIVAVSESVHHIHEWAAGRSGKVSILSAPESQKFTHWTRDAQFTGTAHGKSISLISKNFDRDSDRDIACLLAASAGIQVKETSNPIDGGNILVAGSDVLIGSEMLSDGQEWISMPPDVRVLKIGASDRRSKEVVEASEFLPAPWQEHKYLGSGQSTQPQYHLDLYIAPAGKNDAGRPLWTVGCPRLGAERLGLKLLDFADAHLFDQVASKLEATGAEVIRNPMPLFWTDHEKEKLRTWYHLPVNNVLVEIRDEGAKTVWLPCFGEGDWPELKRIDDANEALWRNLGFETVRIPGFLKLAERRGALRCMCNVLERRRHNRNV